MKKRLSFLFAWAILAANPLGSEDRFPRPEFSVEYVTPAPTTPNPWHPGWEWLDAALLAFALGAGAWLALRTRRRGWIAALMAGSLLYFGFVRGGCVCPVGAVQNMALACFGEGYAIPWIVVWFFALPLATALFFGRVFCGAACPLGAVQDLVAWKPLRVPLWLEEALSLLAVVVLGLAVLMAALGAGFPVCRYDPFVGMFRWSATFSMAVAGVGVLLLGVFVARPYCRFLCPYGVLLGEASRLSRWRARISPDKCVRCRLCENACPFGAIRKPTDDRPPEPRSSGVRRLALVLALAPLLLGASALAGYRLGPMLARCHSVVRLADRLRLERTGSVEGTTPESATFRAGGTPATRLEEDARRLVDTFRMGGALLGAFVAFLLWIRIWRHAHWRRRSGYDIDPGRCLSCGRCFDACPLEHKRRQSLMVRAGDGSAPKESGFGE